jgi:type IV pilus assembly protein PilM
VHHEELAKTVSVAMAYFEDTLQTRPSVLNYVGPGGAKEFTRVLGETLGQMLGEYGLRVNDLVSPSSIGMSTGMPPGLAAGVAGALAS